MAPGTTTAAGRTRALDALERLAAWSYQWSSQVSLEPPDLLWLEFDASRKLFGGRTALLGRIETGLVQLGYEYRCALAPSPTAAALLTHAAAPCHVLTVAQLRPRLDPLPLSLLELPAATRSALQSAGLTCIGQVLELPDAALARRFGPETTLYLRRLCCRSPDLRPAWRLPETYRVRCEFEGAVNDAGALLFPLQRLLLEFQGYLRARDCAVLRFTLELEHERGAASSLSIGLSAPGREAREFLALARERLATLDLPAPVRALRLQALEFTAPAILQADLFGSDAQRLAQLQLLLDRLAARLGATSVRGLRGRPDYRPEHGWCYVEPTVGTAGAMGAMGTAGALGAMGAEHPSGTPSRPCYLLPEPRQIAAPYGLLAGPERIESGWWDGADAARDYYVARTPEGAQLWVFRDLRGGKWYLQGLWA
jgi:protein ImuB